MPIPGHRECGRRGGPGHSYLPTSVHPGVPYGSSNTEGMKPSSHSPSGPLALPVALGGRCLGPQEGATALGGLRNHPEPVPVVSGSPGGGVAGGRCMARNVNTGGSQVFHTINKASPSRTCSSLPTPAAVAPTAITPAGGTTWALRHGRASLCPCPPCLGPPLLSCPPCPGPPLCPCPPCPGPAPCIPLSFHALKEGIQGSLPPKYPNTVGQQVSRLDPLGTRWPSAGQSRPPRPPPTTGWRGAPGAPTPPRGSSTVTVRAWRAVRDP